MGEEQERINKFFYGEKIISLLDQIKTGSNSPLRILLLVKNFGGNINGFREMSNLEFSLKEQESEYTLWEIKTNYSDDDSHIAECPKCSEKFKINIEKKYKVKNYLIEFSNMEIMILVSNDKSDFEHLISEFNKYYPLISRVFYRAEDLRFILNKINDKENIEVIGKKCIVKRLFDDRKTIVTYQENTLSGIYDRAKRENGWIDSIDVFIRPLSNFSFSRKGVILYSRPFKFKEFFDIILKTIINDLLFERRKILKNKFRSVKDREIKPIIIKFDKEYFLDKSNIERIIGRLNNASSYEVSIMYISPLSTHIEVYDYSNGGGFDIYINSSDKLTIVPQTQVSEVLLEGLILKISDIFEGVVK